MFLAIKAQNRRFRRWRGGIGHVSFQPIAQMTVSAEMAADGAERILSTNVVAADERLEFWCDAICETYVELECDALVGNSEQGPFFGEIRIDDLASIQVSDVNSFGQLVKRTRSCISKSNSDCFLISVQTKGTGAVFQDGRQARLQTGQFALYDSARPYELQFTGPFSQTVLRIPRDLLIQRLPTAEWLTARTLDGHSGVGRVALGMLQGIADQHVQIPSPYSERLRDSLLDLMTLACVDQSDSLAANVSSVQLVQLRSIQHFIDEHLAEEDLTPERIAAQNRISVRYLNMLFAANNTTASRWIWKRRLEFTRTDLSDPRRATQSISEIAYRWGFNDLSHFSRAFRKEFGLAPKDFRAGVLR